MTGINRIHRIHQTSGRLHRIRERGHWCLALPYSRDVTVCRNTCHGPAAGNDSRAHRPNAVTLTLTLSHLFLSLALSSLPLLFSSLSLSLFPFHPLFPFHFPFPLFSLSPLSFYMYISLGLFLSTSSCRILWACSTVRQLRHCSGTSSAHLSALIHPTHAG